MEDVNLPHASAGVTVNEDSGEPIQSAATKEFYRWMDDMTNRINELQDQNAQLMIRINDAEERLTDGGL